MGVWWSCVPVKGGSWVSAVSLANNASDGTRRERENKTAGDGGEEEKVRGRERENKRGKEKEKNKRVRESTVQ